jgi:hypothetical protein
MQQEDRLQPVEVALPGVWPEVSFRVHLAETQRDVERNVLFVVE